LFDFSVSVKASLALLGAIGMMASGFFEGSDPSKDFSNMFWISFWVFFIGLAFSTVSTVYWVKGIRAELDKY